MSNISFTLNCYIYTYRFHVEGDGERRDRKKEGKRERKREKKRQQEVVPGEKTG